jgi:hypothetical protein
VAWAPIRECEGHDGAAHPRETLRYRHGEGWMRLTALPQPSVAAACPARVVEGRIVLLTSHAGFTPPERDHGFPKTVPVFDIALRRRSEAGETAARLATASLVEWRGGCVVPSGELRPGVPSPEVWTLTPGR